MKHAQKGIVLLIVFFIVAVPAFSLFLKWGQVQTAKTKAAATVSQSKQHPMAVEGLLDLSRWDFTSQGTIPLNGEWEFYPEKLLIPGQLAGHPRLVQVPSTWSQASADGGASLSDLGYGTYHLQVRVSDTSPPLSLEVSHVATVYKLWVNGKPLAAVGEVGTDSASMVPRSYPLVIDVPPEVNTLDIVLQVSNFVRLKGGIWGPIHLGLTSDLLHVHDQGLFFDGLVAGGLFVMGLFHIGLYHWRRQDRMMLFFGAISIAIGTRSLVVGNNALVSLGPSIPWEWEYFLAYFCMIIAQLFIGLYVKELYPEETSPVFVRLSNGVAVAFGMLVVTNPPLVYSQWVVLYQGFIFAMGIYVLVVMIKVLRKRKQGHWMHLLGLFFLLVATVNDLLYYNNIDAMTSSDLVTEGLLIFLFFQSLFLTSKYPLALTQAERLTKELADLNASLEEKVIRRTQALLTSHAEVQSANRELAAMEESRRLFFTHVSHELRTPLTTIQGYLKAMLDGVIDSRDTTYMIRIYEKSLYLDRIIQDLFELSKLQAGPIRFAFQEVEWEPFLLRIYEKYEWDMKQKGITYHLRISHPDVKRTARCIVRIDPLRLEQVFENLLSNALRFTSTGGSITIDSVVDRDILTVSIMDTGVGIARDEVDFVFDPFYQGRKGVANGAGLGLPIARLIVERHNGTIRVSSTLGKGARFSLTLPLKLKKNGGGSEGGSIETKGSDR